MSVFDLKREEIEEIQLNRLNLVLMRERERSGFYRGLPEKLKSLDDLKMLPFTDDEDLRRHGNEFLLLSQGEVEKVITESTSGTTGQEKRVFYTKDDLKNTVNLFMHGLSELVFEGSKTMIAMPFSGQYSLGELIAEAVSNLGAIPVKTGVNITYKEMLDTICKENCDSFVGFPITLLGLLRLGADKYLKRALVSGDACPKTVYDEITSYIPLFPHYGSREMGLGGATTCSCHGGMHFREDSVIIEIIDKNGNVLPEGSEGELVITTIGMEAMPIIRYRTGDFTRIIPGKCGCGCECRRIDYVSRKDNRIEVLDNEMFKDPYLIDWRDDIIITVDNITDEDKPLFIAKRFLKL